MEQVTNEKPDIKSLDLLSRSTFVDNLVNIAGILARNEKSVCYAINGSWGVGKSFVLDMFEKHEAIKEFWLFHYNCWEFDYYDEPLVAIIASMLEAIEKQTRVIPDKTKKQLFEIVKIIGKGLWKKGEQFIEEKTGMEVGKIVDTVKTGCDNAEQSLQDGNAFDEYHPLRAALTKFHAQIKELTDSYPIIFVVDELDRCLPEYAIKVLERLHHMFHDIPKVQVIISIDKQQLEHAVRQIFGEKTDVDHYLAKFIAFEIKLSEGTFSDVELLNFRFKEYIERFTYSVYSNETDKHDVEEYQRALFAEMDMRTRIAIIDKCLMLHNLLNTNEEVLDIEYMCIELFMVVIQYDKVNVNILKKDFSRFIPFHYKNKKQPIAGLQHLVAKYTQTKTPYTYYNVDNIQHGSCISANDIWGCILAAYTTILGFKDITIVNQRAGRNTSRIQEYTLAFWNLLQTIC